jgi:hypothetical protein
MYLQLLYGITMYLMQNKLYSYAYNNFIYYIDANINDIDDKINKVMEENIKLKKELEYIKIKL